MEVALTDIVKHEILVGAKSQTQFSQLLDLLEACPEFYIPRGEYHHFNHFGFELAQKGLLGRYTDVSIAFICKYHALPIWSFDRYFHTLAKRKLIRLFP